MSDDSKKMVVTLRVTEKELAILDKLCAEEHRTRSNMIQLLILERAAQS